MNKKEYFEFHRQCTAKMLEITLAKNADYTGGGDDPFANFSGVEAMGICTTEQGFLTRMSDKLSRLASFANQGELKVKDESVTDTLLDLANYCILMAGFIKSVAAVEEAINEVAPDTKVECFCGSKVCTANCGDPAPSGAIIATITYSSEPYQGYAK